MTPIKTFVQGHPVLSFYAAVFLISWGGLLLLAAPGGIPGTSRQVEELMPFALVVLFAGPSLGGIVMTGLTAGRAGLRTLASRLLPWRAGAAGGRWHAVALLPAPLLVGAVLLGLSLLSPAFLPGILTTDAPVTLVVFGIAWGFVGGGFLEELGWTGFAVPTLRRRYHAITTALIVGLLWGAWHFLIAFWAGGSLAGEQPLVIYVAGFLAFYVGALPAYRVLMVWAYDRCGSLPVAMLMHASLSASTLILQPVATGVPYLIWNLVLAAVLWVVVAVVARAAGGQLSCRPIGEQTLESSAAFKRHRP
jgi:membrane protease YdiL (CAAX protease family)